MGLVVVGIVISVVFIAAWWRIFQRVGWSPWLSLLMLVPLVNLLTFLAFVLMRWPVEEGRQLRDGENR